MISVIIIQWIVALMHCIFSTVLLLIRHLGQNYPDERYHHGGFLSFLYSHTFYNINMQCFATAPLVSCWHIPIHATQSNATSVIKLFVYAEMPPLLGKRDGASYPVTVVSPANDPGYVLWDWDVDLPPWMVFLPLWLAALALSIRLCFCRSCARLARK